MIKGSRFEVFHSRIFLGTYRKIQHAFWVQGDLIKRDLSTRWNLVNTQTKGACHGVCIKTVGSPKNSQTQIVLI